MPIVFQIILKNKRLFSYKWTKWLFDNGKKNVLKYLSIQIKYINQ